MRASPRRALAPRLLVALAVLFTPLLAPRRVAAQGVDSTAQRLAPGSRVRLRLTPAADASRGAAWSLEAARLVRMDADSIVVRFGAGTTSFARTDVRMLEVDVARTSRRAAIARWALLGAGAGAATGALLVALSWRCPQDDWCVFSRGEAITIGAVGSGLTGAVIGGTVGALQPHEQWREVPLTADLRVGLALVPRGIGFVLRR